jgi:hypothetical protein
MNDVSSHFEHARRDAMTLPTWWLRQWERRATRRAARGTPTPEELARLLAVRTVLRERDQRT